jgi:biopolymer transport protein ExbD
MAMAVGPAGSQPPPVPPQIVTIDVDFDGTLLWNGETLGTKRELQQRMLAAAAQPVQPEVHLRPNKLVTYEYVAHVMANAQRLGLKQLGLLGNEQFVGEN